MDIQALPYRSDSFDFIYCSHVLEHVPDDRKAMQELHRVLKPGGQCLVFVPTRNAKVTYEDPTIITSAERDAHFGQWDHVRFYGKNSSAGSRALDSKWWWWITTIG